MAVAPLLAGLYAGDVDRLSARATFPELLAWESSQGSLIRGSQAAMRSARRGTPTPMFVKPKGGVGRLTDALAASLGDRVGDRSAGRLARPTLGERGDAGAIVLAVPAFEAGRLLGPTAPAASVDLRRYPVRLDRRRVPGLRRRDAGRAARGDRVRRPAGQGTDDGMHVDQQQVARPGVRLARGGPLLRGWRGRRGRAGRGRRRTSWTRANGICPRVLDLPDRPRGIVGRPVDARDAAIRGGARGAGRADPRDRCPPVSSSSAPPTTGWASPIASGRRARRPSRSWRTSTARRSKRRRLDERHHDERQTLRSTRCIRRSAPATGSAISPRTRWPTSCRRSRTSTSRSTGGSRCAARTRRSGSAPTPTCMLWLVGDRRRGRAGVPRRVPPHAGRAGSPTSPGRSWAWSSRRSSPPITSPRS